MGGSLSYECDADSLLEPGKKSILTSEISGVGADQLFEGLKKYVKDGKLASGQEAKFEVVDHEGGHMQIAKFQIPAMFGGGEFQMHTTFKYDAASRKIESTLFGTEEFWERKTPNLRTGMVVHDAPVRVEFWVDTLEVRASGRLQEGLMSTALAAMGSAAKAHADHPALSEEGKFSVVSDPIEEFGPDQYWDKFKAQLVDDAGATEVPDGTVIQERSSNAEWLVGIKTFTKHMYSPEESTMYVYEYGDDESLTDVAAITTCKMHKAPFRLEQWSMAVPARRAGSMQQKLLEPFVKGTLEMLQQA